MTETWMKPGKTSPQAHLVKAAGSEYFTTACRVLLDRAIAVPATQATSHCFACEEQDKIDRGILPPTYEPPKQKSSTRRFMTEQKYGGGENKLKGRKPRE